MCIGCCVPAPPPGPALRVAVDSVALAGSAMSRLSDEPVDRWRLAVAVTGGGLLG